MNDASIRPAETSDIAAIAGIYAEAVRNGTGTFEIEPPGEAEMARRQQTLLTGRYPYVVVERAGAVVGYAYAGPFHARPAYRWTVEDSIYVAPQCQGRGLGRLLLARLIADAEARGFRQMIAVVGDSSNAASIALHAAFGFRLIGSLQSSASSTGAGSTP
jgi:L-amino acid N-acyltransferase YncA